MEKDKSKLANMDNNDKDQKAVDKKDTAKTDKKKAKKDEDEDTGPNRDWGNPTGENSDQSNQGSGVL